MKYIRFDNFPVPLGLSAGVQGAKIQKNSDSKKKNAKKFAIIPKTSYRSAQKQTEKKSNGDQIERLSQESECRNESESNRSTQIKGL